MGAETSFSRQRFHMPIESAQHTRTFMQWPANKNLYGQALLHKLRAAIATIAKTIARFEPVVMIVSPDQQAQARAMLDPAIDLWLAPIDDFWCRDSGPAFVVAPGGALGVVEFSFNGWGGKQAHEADGRLAATIARMLGVPLLPTGVTGEGGGVECDGAGTLLAHESCWVNANRNSQDKATLERTLLNALGAEKMIWAPGLRDRDITDCHIDALARFVAPGRIVIQLPRARNARDPWNAAAFETYDILSMARDAQGRKLDLVVVHEPERPRIRTPDFVASYVNYALCNGAILSAQFGDDAADAKAEALLAQLYPGRTIVMLDVDAIGMVGGGIHCTTQQQPATS